jgi:hypothetical protein
MVKIYKTIILPIVLNECETWSRTLREEHRLRVFENRVLRRIFGPKRDEVTGEWRKLLNEELHNLYSSPDIIRQVKANEVGGTCGTHRRGEESVQVLVGKPEGKRPLRRPRRRWEDGMRLDLREIGLGGVDWIRLAQDRDRWRAVVSAVMNLRVLATRSYIYISHQCPEDEGKDNLRNFSFFEFNHLTRLVDQEHFINH